ncbi:MAG: hypothetical protein ABIN08_07020 [Caldimonas sp.]
MLVVLAREPRPAAKVWAGRRWLAAGDALVWPALWIVGVSAAPFATGVAGLLVVAGALWFAARRLHDAVLANERYRFTTWRWGRPVAGLVLIGALLKLTSVGFPT